MDIIKSLFDPFGPSRKEIWTQIAKDIGGKFIDGGFWDNDALIYKHAEWQIRLDLYYFSKTTYTRMRAPFVNKDGLYFKIYQEDFCSSIGKFFGMQDIEIGDPFFDDKYIIKGNNPEKIKMLFADAKLKQLIHQQPGIYLEIKDDEGCFGSYLPQGIDELYFLYNIEITQTERLKSLFDLFSVILMRLVQIDSAYENDPKVKLFGD